MTERDKKMVKLLCVLGPILLVVVAYGYSQIQKTKARKARRSRSAEQEVQQNANQDSAAAKGTTTLLSRPPSATPRDKHANVPAAASSVGVSITVDPAAQHKRMQLQWGRDPFIPPDAQGPKISTPADQESPRGEKTMKLQVEVSDKPTGNSGIRSAVLYYGSDKSPDQHRAEGKPPPSETGDGPWTFTIPAPQDSPYRCYVVAADRGKLGSESRSPVFAIAPPPKETVETQIGATDVKLTLRGISRAGGSGIALINDEVVAEGEYIHGYRVAKVVKNGVVLRRGKQEIFLQLKE